MQHIAAYVKKLVEENTDLGCHGCA